MINCKNCNKQTKNKHFCSKNCSAVYNNKNNNRWKDVETKKKTLQRVCHACHESYYGYNEKFCSNECRTLYREQLILSGDGGHAGVRSYLVARYDYCFECKLNEWRGKPITLELEHIDGNCKNNALENCKLLCPNCHSQTDTFKGKNRGNSSRKRHQYY